VVGDYLLGKRFDLAVRRLLGAEFAHFDFSQTADARLFHELFRGSTRLRGGG
jgi:hypothetical protein